MPVRSRRLFGPTVTAASTTATLYTVPAGRTARFSLITVTFTGTGTGAVVLRINSSSGNNLAWVQPTGVPAAYELLRGLVLDPADDIRIVTPANVTAYTAGFGSLLDGAPA